MSVVPADVPSFSTADFLLFVYITEGKNKGSDTDHDAVGMPSLVLIKLPAGAEAGRADVDAVSGLAYRVGAFDADRVC